MSAEVHEIVLRRVRLPLIAPYRLSYRTFTEFEPIIVQVRSRAGAEGWGEGHISPGSSSETREGGWEFCRAMAGAIAGRDSRDAEAIVATRLQESKVAGSAIISAIEMMENHPALSLDSATEFPLVAAFQAAEPGHIEDQAETLLAQGYRTFKVKVGNDVPSDLARVSRIQAAVSGRAFIRIDANRGYSQTDAIRFATQLN